MSKVTNPLMFHLWSWRLIQGWCLPICNWDVPQLLHCHFQRCIPRKGKSGPDEEKEKFKVRKMLRSIVCVPKMVVIQTGKVAVMTRRASANMSEMIVKLYNVERFVMKSIPLAAADMPSRGDVRCFQHALKPHTYYVSCLSSISVAPR